MSKRQEEWQLNHLELIAEREVKFRMYFLDGLLELFAWLVVYCFPTIFIFLLIVTVAMKERDTKLKFREIVNGLFKKLF
jgi:hypothetical protein